MVKPYDLLQSLLKTCPGKFRFRISELEKNNWKVLDLLGEVKDVENLPEQVCDLMPEFNHPEEVVRFFYSLINYPPAEVLAKYRELEEVKKEAVRRLKYDGAERDVNDNVVLATGIYLLYKYGRLDDLKPVDTILGAFTEIENLLPSNVSGEYAIYVLGSEGRRAKVGVQRVIREKKESEEGGERESNPVYILVRRAVSYCKSSIIPKPNFPFPNEDFVTSSAFMSLSSRLGRENITVPDIDLIDVSEIDCNTCYNYAVEYYKEKYGGDLRYWTQAGGGAIARCIASQLFNLIKKVAERKELSKEEVRAMEERYETETREEERELEETEKLLSQLYRAVTGEEKPIGIGTDKIPDFLMTYLSLLNQAGLEPKDYEELSRMFATFLQILNEAKLPPSQYKELLDRILVLPPDVRKSIAASLVTVLKEYEEGRIGIQQALDEMESVLKMVRVEEKKVPVEVGKSEKKEEEREVPVETEEGEEIPVEIGTTFPVEKEVISSGFRRLGKKREEEEKPREEEEEKKRAEPEVIAEVRKYPNLYTVTSSHDDFVKKLREYGVRRALVITYGGAIFVIPAKGYAKTVKIIVYYDPKLADTVANEATKWARKIYDSLGPFEFGDEIIGVDALVDPLTAHLTFQYPVVDIEKFKESPFVYILTLPGVNLCILSDYFGKFYGVVESCTVSEKPGTILELSTLSPVQKKV